MSSADLGSPVGFGRPATPPSDSSSQRAESPELIPRHQGNSDDEDDEGYAKPRYIAPKKGGYDSRIEQIIYENPDLPILITSAGKNLEGGGSYIAYTIRTGVGFPGLYSPASR
jgi:sorting nexin-41/42